MKKYKVLRYNLKHKVANQNTIDGVQRLEDQLNALSEDGFEPKMFIESMDDLKLGYALILEREGPLDLGLGEEDK